MGIWTFDFQLDVSPYGSFDFLWPIIFLSLLFLFAIYPTTRKSLLAKIDFKSTWQLLIVHLAVSLVLLLIAPAKDGSEFSFLFFPLTIIFANFLQIIERYWIKEGILYLFLLSLILIQI